MKLSQEVINELELIVNKCEEKFDDDSESIIIANRYDYIEDIISETIKNKSKNKKESTISEKIDKIVTNRFLALPIFAFVMWFVYYISVSKIGLMGTDWINDGILAGIGTVLSFIPQVALLFFFLSLLEDCGYMSRIALFMDKILRRFGLSGKSFIPVLMSSGCGVPGIMSTRTMESERERKITIMVSTFVPCSAKLPIIALFAGALSFIAFNMFNLPCFAAMGAIKREMGSWKFNGSCNISTCCWCNSRSYYKKFKKIR